MGRLIIKTISLFGRYSILLLLPPLTIAVWGWLWLLDDHIVVALVLALPVWLAALATIVLILGMLFARVRRPQGITVDRAAAPELWRYWDTASPKGANVRRQIIIDAEINAAMAQHLRFVGLFGRDETLVLGLGLLILLDRPAVEAVLEHEIAHAELKHSAGLTRIHEFLNTYEAFDGYLSEDLPLVELFLEAVFPAFANWLWREYRRQSKIHEVQADRQSADRLGTDVEARSQILSAGGAHIAKATIYDPLEKELLGALVAPKPPLDRILERRAELTDLGNLEEAVKEILQEDPEPDSTHPTLEERLTAIGAEAGMAIEPVGPPALDTMLPGETRDRLLHDINKEWTERADAYVRLE